VIGDDLDSNTLGGPFGNFTSRTQAYGTLQAEQTWMLGEGRDLVGSAGARYDDSNRDGSETSPLASIELRRAEGALRRAYVSYAESTQLPTYTALNNNPAGLFGGNPNLPRATAENIELGADWAAGEWTVQTAVFRRYDDNLLDYIFDPTGGLGTSRRAAAADIVTLGAEIFAQRSWERFDLLAGYTFLDKDDNYAPPFNGSFYALNYAEHRLTLGGIARLGGGFEVRMDNELRRQAENALRREGNDNVDTAVGIFYSVPGVKGLTLNAQVENLWDTAYQDVPLVPHAPRSWSVGANYVW
jgi:outer membrane receptor protein involved in Fe transport